MSALQVPSAEEGHRLVRAFLGIGAPEVRAAVVHVVERLSGSPTGLEPSEVEGELLFREAAGRLALRAQRARQTT